MERRNLTKNYSKINRLHTKMGDNCNTSLLKRNMLETERSKTNKQKPYF